MTLVVVTHGTRNPAGATTSEQLARAIAQRAPGVPVALAYADVRRPSVTEVVADVEAPVVVPALLASGYHVRVDIPAQIERSGRTDVLLASPLGPAPAVVRAAVERLLEAGWRRSDALVLAAAGSSDKRARADVRKAATQLSRTVRRPVTIGYIATGSPTIDEAVVAARRTARRVSVASWLLAPGLFHNWLAESDADVVSDPLGVHPFLVDELIRRYQAALVRVSPQPIGPA